MKNRTFILIIFFSLVAFTMVSFKKNNGIFSTESKQQVDLKGKALFIEKCTKCHNITPSQTKREKRTMLAPAMSEIMFLVNKEIKTNVEKEKREKIVTFILDYVHFPSVEKSFCKAETIERFGVMPSQKNNVTIEELKQIAEYLYNLDGMKNLQK